MPAVALDAPIGGLNGIDGVDAMPPTDAIQLDNWIPRSGYLQSRPGYTRHTSDLGADVETLVAYTPSGADQLIAGANSTLLNVTAGGAGTLLYYSTNLITNGVFGADTDWTKGTGWSIAAGVADCDGTQVAASNLYQGSVTTDAKTYYVKFTVAGYIAGSVRCVIGTTGTGTSRSANGTYAEYITAGGTNPDRVNIEADANFVGKIDDVEVYAVAEDYTNDRWQTAMFQDKMIFCNGADAEMAYDGTDLTALDYTGSSPAITPGEFVGITVFKGRAYYWKNAAASFWYAAAGGYQGDITEFPLGTVLHLGGKVVSMFPWTVDTGTGPDDMLCILTDIGELVLYQGDDPGNLGYFEQVGSFRIPPPLSVRGQMKYGADVLIMTENGYVNLASVLKENQMSDYPAFSRKIARLVYDAGKTYKSNYGHECLQTDLGLLLFNVPIGNNKANQYVMNENTGAWSRLTDLNAVTWTVYAGNLYFGGMDNYVCKVTGYSDNDGSIRLTALPAYNYFNDPGNRKHITAVNIHSTHPDPKLIELTGYADFKVPTLEDVDVPSGGDVIALWDTGDWGDYWFVEGGINARATSGWQNVSAFGYAVTVSVLMAIKTQTLVWRQTGIRYKNAGAQ